MPDQHAVLSPSSAERWIECPASVRLAATIPQGPESPYAHEGTVAHSLAELKGSLHFGKITHNLYVKRHNAWLRENMDLLQRDEVLVEMERHTDAYVDLLDQRMSLHRNSQIMLEQRMDAGVPSCWGTSDAVIVSPVHVEIVDFKYGSGVAVEARGNPQLRLYACGALDTFGDILGETENVRITVHQPRMDHVLTDEMTPEALRTWRDETAVPAAQEALSDDAHFGPSEKACRWCPASGRCKAQLEDIFSEPFPDPETMSPLETAAALAGMPKLRNWMKAFEEAALTMAYSEGTRIPGYKVVLSGGQRSVQDPDMAIKILTGAGYAEGEITNTKIKGIGELEKLLGRDGFAQLLEEEGIVQRSDGKPAIVPESDKRPPVAPNIEAGKVFSEEPS
jgi:hypothetical protein